MKILAIETSCDDTGIAILEASGFKKPFFKVLSNIVSSQAEIHRKYGGVYPTLAKREHQKNLVPVLIQALKESKLQPSGESVLRPANSLDAHGRTPRRVAFQTLKRILIREEFLYKKLIAFLRKYQKPKVDLIAVTNGPGLEPCLWVGVNFAKALSYFWDIPIAPVNHIESHILVNFLNQHLIKFPAVCLVVSGGHTQLILMRGLGKYKIIGETRDDAAGECFDKTARILGLGYPGGPAIAKIASQRNEDRGGQTSSKLPRPMIYSKDYDFSFSGLKTAVLYHHKNQLKEIQKNKEYIKSMCQEIQQAVIDVLIKKTIKAAKDYNAKIIILGGGVTANEELRKQFAEKIAKELPNTQYLIPDTQLCTDNAVMVAITAYFHKTQTRNWQKIRAKANLRIS